ncbi:hypothetical protein JYB88_05230 [Shewanella cyperi]|uniref:Uncharacterized protein n=1 Tax=Shewanella cyperi TaxID=2814292 RepID=A0A974XPI0_9GAMM|nr:hypothetical protein [Shewanella cyperi]QSX31048.1 hypothetical protein JYB88_05230 [Shewanella cyperi]
MPRYPLHIYLVFIFALIWSGLIIYDLHPENIHVAGVFIPMVLFLLALIEHLRKRVEQLEKALNQRENKQ